MGILSIVNGIAALKGKNRYKKCAIGGSLSILLFAVFIPASAEVSDSFRVAGFLS